MLLCFELDADLVLVGFFCSFYFIHFWCKINTADFYKSFKLMKKAIVMELGQGSAGRGRGRGRFNFHGTPEDEDVQDGDEDVQGRRFSGISRTRAARTRTRTGTLISVNFRDVRGRGRRRPAEVWIGLTRMNLWRNSDCFWILHWYTNDDSSLMRSKPVNRNSLSVSYSLR